eukprot:scaffold568_cov376-Prasinococcus_capsulatus_cf.AAC.12
MSAPTGAGQATILASMLDAFSDLHAKVGFLSYPAVTELREAAEHWLMSCCLRGLSSSTLSWNGTVISFGLRCKTPEPQAPG